jgi:hypothetical protein
MYRQVISTTSRTIEGRAVDDYLTRDDLLALGLDPREADAVLALSDLTGHGGEPSVAADQLDDLLGLIRHEQEDEL